MTNAKQELPHDTEAELDVLAQIFDDPRGPIHLVADKLRPEHFFLKIHELIYRAALALSDGGQDVGVANAEMWLADKGLLKLGGGHLEGRNVRETLLASVHFRAPRLRLEPAALRVREKHAQREAIVLAHRLASAAGGDVGTIETFLEDAADAFVRIRRALTDVTIARDVHSIHELVEDYAGRIDRNENREFVTTGCADLDLDLGGWEYGDVAVFGAPTNWGKSMFLVMMADEAIKANKRPLIVTFEDKPMLYLRRFLARHKQLSAYELKYMKLNDEAKSVLERFRGETKADAYKLPFIVNGIGRPIETVISRVRRICQLAKYDLILWDYAQAMKSRERFKDKRERLDHVVREATDCTKEVGAAGILASQFKRLSSGEEPTMFDLKESGDIENGAETVLLGFNDGDGAPRVRLAKSKDSSKFIDYPVSWDPRSASMKLGSRIKPEPKSNEPEKAA